MEAAAPPNYVACNITYEPPLSTTPNILHSSTSSQSSSLPLSSHSYPQSPVQGHLSAGHHSTSSDSSMELRQTKGRLQRPRLVSRKSSGSIIVPRDSSVIEVTHEEYDSTDARAMSPRRTSDEIDRMGDDARQALEQFVFLTRVP